MEQQCVTVTGIGQKIMNYRRTKDMTIKEMATRTGLSTSLISQLERGIGNPTFGALNALADVMEISLSNLVSEQIENKDLVCRKEHRVTMRDEGGLSLKSMLVEDSLSTSLSVLALELQPKASNNTCFEVHNEEECLCVTEGSIVVIFEGEEILLESGDSIRILPNRPHMVRNDGDVPATAVNIKCKVQY